jgi:hypothetical protein
MASIEIDTLWHGHATTLSHSQEWVGWEGLEYDAILSALIANPDMTADDVAIVSALNTTDLTWSAVAVDDRLDVLLSAVDDLSVSLLDTLDHDRSAYVRAFNHTFSFKDAPMDKDLYNLVQQIQSQVGDPLIQAKCQAVLAAFDSVVLAQRHGALYESAHGITIYGAATHAQQMDQAYYGTLDFARQTHWLDFLNALANP